jgi:hypothetical protein
MIFTIAASVIDTIIIKTSVYALEKTVYGIFFTGSSIYNWYYDIKKIEDKDEEYYHIEIDELKHEIYELKMALKKRD